MDQLTAPSIRTIQAVYQALTESVERVDSDSRAVLDALRLLGDTLDVAKGSASLSGGLGLLGPMALPIPLAMRAVMAPVSKYVQQRTGISLYGWMDFVESTQKQFEEYLVQLEQVAALESVATPPAGGPAAAPPGTLSKTTSMPSHDAARRADETLLLETRGKTRVWRPVLEQVGRLGDAMDAMLDGWREESKRFDLVGGKAQDDGWSQNFGGLFQGAAAKVSDHLAGARLPGQNYFLSAFSDLRERASLFHEQVRHLSRSFADLEDLLDLEIAQFRARAGELPIDETDRLRQRVAATVLVPRLVQQLATARARDAALRDRLEKLKEAYQSAAIDHEIHATLAAEYEAGLATVTAQLAALEAESEVWQVHGQQMLQDAASRVQKQVEMVRARQLVGELQEVPARERLERLERELGKVREASRVVETLTPSVAPQPTAPAPRRR